MSYIDFLSQRVHISSCLSSHLFMQRNKSCDQNRGTGLKAETNPDINVKLERGKCETVRFSLTARDYTSFLFFFFFFAWEMFSVMLCWRSTCRSKWLLKIANVWRSYCTGEVKRISKVQYRSEDTLSRVAVDCFPFLKVDIFTMTLTNF